LVLKVVVFGAYIADGSGGMKYESPTSGIRARVREIFRVWRG
jgi:hypothetical protein